MKIRHWGLVLALALNPALATANGLYLGFIADSTLEVEDSSGSVEIDGDGFSLGFDADFANNLYAFGEYLDRGFEEGGPELEITQTRFGLGLFQGIEGSSAGRFYAGINWERAKVSALGSASSENGLGLRAGALLGEAEGIQFRGEVAYVSIDESDGFELLARVTVPLNPQLGLFVDYRFLELEDDDDFGASTTLSVDDIRLGVRLGF